MIPWVPIAYAGKILVDALRKAGSSGSGSGHSGPSGPRTVYYTLTAVNRQQFPGFIEEHPDAVPADEFLEAVERDSRFAHNVADIGRKIAGMLRRNPGSVVLVTDIH